MGLEVTHRLAARGFETSLQPFVQPHDDLHDMPQSNGVKARSHESFIDQGFAAPRPSQPSSISRCARIATPIVGLLVAGAGAYALASGVNRDNYDQTDTYHLNLVNGLSGAAGAVGGALVSALGHYAVRAYCCVRDRTVEVLIPRDEDLAGQVNPSDLEASGMELVSGQRARVAGERESKASEVELEPGMPLAEADFTTVESAERQEQLSQPQPQATRKVPTGGFKLQEAREIDGWIEFSKQLKAGQVVTD
jgi:hypothetical protein